MVELWKSGTIGWFSHQNHKLCRWMVNPQNQAGQGGSHTWKSVTSGSVGSVHKFHSLGLFHPRDNQECSRENKIGLPFIPAEHSLTNKGTFAKTETPSPWTCLLSRSATWTSGWRTSTRFCRFWSTTKKDKGEKTASYPSRQFNDEKGIIISARVGASETSRLTDRPPNWQTDRPGHRKVLLPIITDQ